MRQCGWTTPILIDANNMIIAGHGRKEAAKLLCIEEVPTIRLDGLTKEQIRANVITDNKLAENAGGDREILTIEFQELLALDCLDITVTGFEIAEIDLILEEAKGAPEEEALPEPEFDQEPITQPGDLWLLGKHRIVCGSSLHRATYRELMGNHRAAMVFTDPPFNVRVDGHATGNGAIRHREFAMASGR
jgi:ParB-like chromosome segregation protein Spo0J